VPAEPTAPDVRALIAEMREVADRVFGQNAPLGPLLALQLSTWASRLEAALSSSSGTPRETLREEALPWCDVCGIGHRPPACKPPHRKQL
jgi:hypothetical protein